MADDAPPVTTEEVAPAPAAGAAVVEDAPTKEVASDNSAPEASSDAAGAAATEEKKDGAEEAAGAAEDVPAAAEKVSTPASSKKKTPSKALGGRRKSLANMKKNTPKKAAAVDKKFEAGDYVIARMKSYPPWPAIILNEELLPELLKKGPGRGGAKATEDKGLGASAWKTQYPIFFLGTYEYAWTSIADLDPLTDEILEAGPSRKNKKGLSEAFEEVKTGWTLKHVKDFQDGNMEIDEAADEEVDEMEVDEEEEEPPSEDEKPKKKRGTKRKKSESASDDEEVEPEKPAKTPKKAVAKAKTPKSAAKAKTPKTPANGVKSKAKAAASSVKKSTTKKSAKKSAETVDESGSEADSEKSQFANPEELTDTQKEEIMMHRRHKLQKCLLNKDKVIPDAAEMPAMDKYLKSLETWPNITGSLLKTTKIHKVLKGVMKKKDGEIPLDDKFKFRERCKTLFEQWNKLVVELDNTETKENGVAATTNGQNGDLTKDEEATKDEKEVAVGKDAPSAAPANKENAKVEEKDGETATEAVEAK